MIDVEPTESALASAARIEAELAHIPVGSTLRHISESEAAPPLQVVDAGPWDIVPPEGRYTCSRECGALVTLPGLCAPCCLIQDNEDASAEFAAALDSIPEAFRWAKRDASELPVRCNITASVAANARRIDSLAMKLLTGEVRFVTIRGVANAGKTSLACAVLRTVIDGARDSWILHRRIPQKIGRHDVAPEPKLVTVGRAARFVATNDLLVPRSRDSLERSSFDIARGCSLLVLDDLGQELQARDDAISASERAQAVKDVIAHRWNRAKPTLITTYLSDSEITAAYGGGTQKRITWASEVMLIKLGGNGNGKEEDKGSTGRSAR